MKIIFFASFNICTVSPSLSNKITLHRSSQIYHELQYNLFVYEWDSLASKKQDVKHRTETHTHILLNKEKNLSSFSSQLSSSSHWKRSQNESLIISCISVVYLPYRRSENRENLVLLVHTHTKTEIRRVVRKLGFSNISRRSIRVGVTK